MSQRLTNTPLATAVAPTVKAWDSVSGDSIPVVSLIIRRGEFDGMGKGYDQSVETVLVTQQSSSC